MWTMDVGIIYDARNARHGNHSEPTEQNHVYFTTEDKEEPTFLTLNLPVKFS